MKLLRIILVSFLFTSSILGGGNTRRWWTRAIMNPLGIYLYSLVDEIVNEVTDEESDRGVVTPDSRHSSLSPQEAMRGVPFADRVTLKDVRGQDEVKAEVAEVVDFLKNSSKYERFGAKIPKGILLEGPPGTGKTLLARAIAGEAGCRFYATSGSEFLSMWVGETERSIRALFDQARANAPAIVFIDEIDTIGGVNRGSSDTYPWARSHLNELLNQLDGFRKHHNVVVIAATNCATSLDPALLRPGRLTRIIKVPLPSRSGRADILEYYLNRLPYAVVDSTIQIGSVSDITVGFSGADLENLVNEAAIHAARESADRISMKHFEEALDKIVMGLKNRMDRTDEQLKRTAYHEAGHALVQVLTGQPVARISIVSRGHALGFTMGKNKNETFSDYTKEELESMIMAMQGGYVAENIMFDQATPGVSDDLRKATDIAIAMVYNFGMSEKYKGISPIVTSESSKEAIDKEVHNILSSCREQTDKLLRQNKYLLSKLALGLLEKEVMSEKEIYEIVGR